ncbi:TIGR02588 family protein [Scytonema sp. UIC 10036]|uniref:TIGR02588 family protein n=1 Tax=Scytonema sp. UIC 10036 TaxID=2304196 RepID=UPI0012DA5683|nr:TIGR02588 family protein [Scytonema sp. UIC 10036]MUG99014.1 TIGR02588 family protein [Scytonema sp. UIC 10036]
MSQQINELTDSYREQQQPKRSLAEWVTFGAASFILAVVVSLVCYTWLNDKQEPPVLSVSNKQAIRQVNGHFYVPFEVVNTGGETAESIQVVAELRMNGEVTETGDIQIDFLSTNETEKGAFIFSRDPRQGELIIRVASYKLP